MMTKANWWASVLGVVVLMISGMRPVGAHANERAEAKATLGDVNVTIEYGRPMLRGRDPLKMIRPGALWRLGADESTTISFDADLDFGGTRVPKGKYILLARLVQEGKWLLTLSRKGAVDYEPSAKVAEVPMDVIDAPSVVEELTIRINAKKDGRGVIEVTWGNALLQASFTVPK